MNKIMELLRIVKEYNEKIQSLEKTLELNMLEPGDSYFIVRLPKDFQSRLFGGQNIKLPPGCKVNLETIPMPLGDGKNELLCISFNIEYPNNLRGTII